MKTLQAISPRRTCSTHASSNVIHSGGLAILLGFVLSQKDDCVTFLYLKQISKGQAVKEQKLRFARTS